VRIIIEGERGEGKSTLAIILAVMLRRLLNYSVDRSEEGVPNIETVRLNREEVLAQKQGLAASFARMERRHVDIIVRNPVEAPR
jgi:nucleoside-triphosphatase THEP1